MSCTRAPDLGKRLVKAPKLHLVDTGLACHLVGADAQRLGGDRPLQGRILETFVVGELRKQLSWTFPHMTFFIRCGSDTPKLASAWLAELVGRWCARWVEYYAVVWKNAPGLRPDLNRFSIAPDQPRSSR